MGLITSLNYCKYFLLFKPIAEHTTVLTFSQLVESNCCCNVSGRKNFVADKFIEGRRPYNRAGDREFDKSNSGISIKRTPFVPKKSVRFMEMCAL